jgi:putative lipoprotein
VRTVEGSIVLPADIAATTARSVLVEARDVSVMDAPSTVVAETRMTDVPVGPGERIPFRLDVPEVDPSRTLSVRAHVSLDGTPAITTGDALSVTHIPLPAAGPVDRLDVPLRTV